MQLKLTIFNNWVRKLYHIFVLAVLLCTGCEWNLKLDAGDDLSADIRVKRYDRIESLYLTTGDLSALQHMNTDYPMQTLSLIEDVLKIGSVNDPQINSKFLEYYQDTVLQTLIKDVECQYADMDDIDRELTQAFTRLREALPEIEIPMIYAQIGSLDHSIIVGDNTLGICLDKYLGFEYPLYLEYYNVSQRRSMIRPMIVPDCLVFYLLSLYPMPDGRELSQLEHDIHMGKIQWVVNKVTRKPVFFNKNVSKVDRYMKKNKNTGIEQLLMNNDYALLSGF